jgi:hypothetical protein
MLTFDSYNTFLYVSNLSDLVYAFRMYMYVLHVHPSPLLLTLLFFQEIVNVSSTLSK